MSPIRAIAFLISLDWILSLKLILQMEFGNCTLNRYGATIKTPFEFYIRDIMMCFLINQGGFEVNSTCYLMKIQCRVSKKDA